MIRHLTLASKAQQKEWLALFEDPEQHAPQAYQLKQWLFGGQSIPTKSALFPLAEYPGRIVADLFGEEGYFAEAELFWQKQNEAIAAKRDALLAAGWAEVVMLETGQGFSGWRHEKSADNHSDFRVLTQGIEIGVGWVRKDETSGREYVSLSLACLGGPAMSAPIMCNDAIALIEEKHHLRVPTICRERPAVAEHDGLTFAPILVEDLDSVACLDRRRLANSLFDGLQSGFTVG